MASRLLDAISEADNDSIAACVNVKHAAPDELVVYCFRFASRVVHDQMRALAAAISCDDVDLILED